MLVLVLVLVLSILVLVLSEAVLVLDCGWERGNALPSKIDSTVNPIGSLRRGFEYEYRLTPEYEYDFFNARTI